MTALIQVKISFLSKFKKTKTCWLWTAAKKANGYGVLGTNRGPTLYAHRVSFEIFHGQIPKGMHVCHRCDVPACVNPYHLFLGSAKANTADRIAKGRTFSGERHPGVKLTEEQVLRIRKLYPLGGVTQEQLAQEFGVTRKCVGRILTGKSWTHL